MIKSTLTTHVAAIAQGELFDGFDPVADGIGKRIASGILARIESFPQREALLARQKGRMDSLPEDILWEGLGEEAAPVFVVYKLLHEAFSNAPQFFRSALVEFLRAQPDRFSAVFNRETIWSVLASIPVQNAPQKSPLVENIAHFLTQAQRRGIWWRSDEEIRREAEAIHHSLSRAEGGFWKGFAALRALQTEKARGITCGNLLLNVPGRLAAYASEIVSLGRQMKLPPLQEIHARVDEFSRDREQDARHESIPLDLLYTTLEDDLLHVRLLVRAKATPAERAEIRRRSLYLRYFLRKAFSGYQVSQLDIKLAFYLDDPGAHIAWHGNDSLFHPEEWVDRDAFWNDLCPGAQPQDLFAKIRSTATQELAQQHVVEKLKLHFSRLHPAYFETHFAIAGNDEDWPSEFAIITAYQTTGKRWSADRNVAADNQLAAELQGRNGVRRVTGYSPSTGHEEPGWSIQMSWQEACDLGRQFHQDAIYYVTGDDLWVSLCDDRRSLVRVGSFRSRITKAMIRQPS